jgi:phage shock protein A
LPRGVIYRLKKVEQYVARAESAVANQRTAVKKVHPEGVDSAEAKALLAELEEWLASCIASRDRLRRELDAAEAPADPTDERSRLLTARE